MSGGLMLLYKNLSTLSHCGLGLCWQLQHSHLCIACGHLDPGTIAQVLRQHLLGVCPQATVPLTSHKVLRGIHEQAIAYALSTRFTPQ